MNGKPTSKDRETVLNHKFIELSKLLNIYLNHFPRHEKYALANTMRQTAYRLYDLITECQKRHFVEKFLYEELHMEYSHWMISKIKRGINFVGYRTWKSVKFVRKHSMYKFRRAMKKAQIESMASLIGHAKGTATLRYYRKLLIEHKILNQLPKRSQACLSM